MAPNAEPSFTIGSIRAWFVADGSASYSPDWLFPGMDRHVWEPAVAGRLGADGTILVPYQPVLLEVDGRLILVDAGTGVEFAQQWEVAAGTTSASLGSLGIAPGEVGVVVVTHGHADHIGGLTQADGAGRSPVFDNARHVLSRIEWDHWRSDAVDDEDDRETFDSRVSPVHDAGLLDLVEGETEVAPGVTVFPTPGHTPGHMSISLSSRDQTGLIAGDAIMGDWSFAHPEWVAVFDVDPERCVRTRLDLLERAARDGTLVTAYHVVAAGRVHAAGEAFRFEANA